MDLIHDRKKCCILSCIYYRIFISGFMSWDDFPYKTEDYEMVVYLIPYTRFLYYLIHFFNIFFNDLFLKDRIWKKKIYNDTTYGDYVFFRTKTKKIMFFTFFTFYGSALIICYLFNTFIASLELLILIVDRFIKSRSIKDFFKELGLYIFYIAAKVGFIIIFYILYGMIIYFFFL